MTKDDYLKLVEEVRLHDYLYFVQCAPRISDYEYDRLLEKLSHVEKEHPGWVLPTSPTQRISPALSKGFVQRAHVAPMLSLANTYSEEEIAAFIERVYKGLDRKDVDFYCELKMDGVAISLRYENGIFVRGWHIVTGKHAL